MPEPQPGTDITGPHGTARYVPYPEDPNHPQLAAHLATYLIDAPVYHPIWSQYILSAVHLRPIPGVAAEPVFQFEGATHEVSVLALNPDHIQTPESMLGMRVPVLTPVNIAAQFVATDEQTRDLAWLLAYGVVFGVLNPETGDAPTRIRQSWDVAIAKTLAHMRGEVHEP